MQHKRFGFTLIELLIVVAIIGILAAIAVPNFLAARTRASVARVKADHRSYATAFESYFLDNNHYPDGLNSGCGYVQYLKGLTTPVSYIADIRLIDPWHPEPSQFAVGCPDWIGTYLYVSLAGYWGRSVYPEAIKKGYVVMSYGPDRFQDNAEHFPHCYSYPQYCKVTNKKPLDMLYNSSNGVISGGDIARVGGEISAPVVIGG